MDASETHGTVPALVLESSGVLGFWILPWSPGDMSITLPDISTGDPLVVTSGDAVTVVWLWPMPNT